MINEVTINGITSQYIKFSDVEELIVDTLKTWNNFEAGTPLSITIKKSDDPSSLKVKTQEDINTNDIMGRR